MWQHWLIVLSVGRASHKWHEMNQTTECIQHQHFYLPTCQPISRHTCYSQIMPSFAFSFTLPASILGFHHKRLIRPARPICFIFFSLYLFSSPLFLLPICLLYLVLFFTLPPPPLFSLHPLSDGTQMSSCAGGPLHLQTYPPLQRPGIPSDKPYNVWQHKEEAF